LRGHVALALAQLDDGLAGRAGHTLKRLAALEIKLEVSDSALAQVATAGFDPVYGARPLKRAIQQTIENPLVFLLVCNIVLLIVGCFMELLAAMLILIPIVFLLSACTPPSF
jgi:TRAP-type mannitol/chloroaromatic compound transport system permease large subunit